MSNDEKPDYIPANQDIVGQFRVVDAVNIEAGILALSFPPNRNGVESGNAEYYLFRVDESGIPLEGHRLLVNSSISSDGFDNGFDGYRLVEPVWDVESPNSGIALKDQRILSVGCLVPRTENVDADDGVFRVSQERVVQNATILSGEDREALELNVKAGYVPIYELNGAYVSQGVFEIPERGHVFFFGGDDASVFLNEGFADKKVVYVHGDVVESRDFTILSEEEAGVRNIPYKEGRNGHVEGLGTFMYVHGEGYKLFGDDGSETAIKSVYPIENALDGDDALEAEIMDLVDNPVPKLPCPGTM